MGNICINERNDELNVFKNQQCDYGSLILILFGFIREKVMICGLCTTCVSLIILKA